MTDPKAPGYPPWDSSIDPAPGDLRVVQAFVNTLDIEKGTDELETAEGLAHWLGRWRLARRGAAVTEAEWRQAVELREGLRELLLANGGEAGEEASRQGLERALADLPLRCALGSDGTFDLVAVGGAWPQAAARLLTIVTRAMGDGTWQRLKACRRHDCRWAFWDGSKNRSGKWCAMAGCGDLMKARAYRRRLRSGCAAG